VGGVVGLTVAAVALLAAAATPARALSVYRESTKAFADKDAVWYFESTKAFADRAVYFESTQAFADLVIAYTDTKAFATCKKAIPGKK
jgi:hypothetical protein